MNDALLLMLFSVSILITLSSLDDAFIDLLAMGITRLRAPLLGDSAGSVPKTAVFVANWQCASKARIISGGRIHPESCRLIRKLTSGLAG